MGTATSLRIQQPAGYVGEIHVAGFFILDFLQTAQRAAVTQ